jgi:hypothetical protein
MSLLTYPCSPGPHSVPFLWPPCLAPRGLSASHGSQFPAPVPFLAGYPYTRAPLVSQYRGSFISRGAASDVFPALSLRKEGNKLLSRFWAVYCFPPLLSHEETEPKRNPSEPMQNPEPRNKENSSQTSQSPTVTCRNRNSWAKEGPPWFWHWVSWVLGT